MTEDRCFVLTGAFGSGKSTLLEGLRSAGYQCVEEPARPVLAAQRREGGDGLPERDARLFVSLMLSRALEDYDRMGGTPAPVFFDRGIPDLLAYAALFGFEFPGGWKAAEERRYARRVFFAPAWEPIYTRDDERTVSFSEASRFGDMVRSVYEELGYVLIDLPLLPATQRVIFVLSRI